MGAALRRSSLPARLVALVLAGAIFLASVVLAALPLASLWLISRLDFGYTEIYLLALIACPVAILAWGLVLLRLNRIYLELAERDARPVLEASITLAVLLAVAALVLWVVILGAPGSPNRGPWPG